VGRSVLASELEAMLGLKIKDEDINKIFTVGELIEYIAGVIK
jgi:acyl carrier protein